MIDKEKLKQKLKQNFPDQNNSDSTDLRVFKLDEKIIEKIKFKGGLKNAKKEKEKKEVDSENKTEKRSVESTSKEGKSTDEKGDNQSKLAEKSGKRTESLGGKGTAGTPIKKIHKKAEKKKVKGGKNAKEKTEPRGWGFFEFD